LPWLKQVKLNARIFLSLSLALSSSLQDTTRVRADYEQLLRRYTTLEAEHQVRRVRRAIAVAVARLLSRSHPQRAREDTAAAATVHASEKRRLEAEASRAAALLASREEELRKAHRDQRVAEESVQAAAALHTDSTQWLAAVVRCVCACAPVCLCVCAPVCLCACVSVLAFACMSLIDSFAVLPHPHSCCSLVGPLAGALLRTRQALDDIDRCLLGRHRPRVSLKVKGSANVVNGNAEG
jgi:hypothetical protein